MTRPSVVLLVLLGLTVAIWWATQGTRPGPADGGRHASFFDPLP